MDKYFSKEELVKQCDTFKKIAEYDFSNFSENDLQDMAQKTASVNDFIKSVHARLAKEIGPGITTINNELSNLNERL